MARQLIQALPAASQVGISVFSDRIEKSIPPTQDRTGVMARLAAVESDTAKGRTALWDAIAEVVSSQFEPPRQGDSIYLISDAGDNKSKTTVKDLKKALLSKQIRLFAFSTPVAPVNVPRGGSVDLEMLVEATGGYKVEAPVDERRALPWLPREPGKPAAVSSLLSSQFHLIFTYANVEMELAQRISKEQSLDLRLKEQAQRSPGLVYPHLLAACENELAVNPTKEQ